MTTHQFEEARLWEQTLGECEVLTFPATCFSLEGHNNRNDFYVRPGQFDKTAQFF